jgi:hypothetical protein
MKRVYLMGMIEWSLWNRTYLRKYADASSSHSILPTTESQKDDEVPEKQTIPWQDAVVRLAYYLPHYRQLDSRHLSTLSLGF